MIPSNRVNKEKVSLTLNGNDFSRIISHKFLGVMIDEPLKVDVHINKVCTKVSQSIGVIRRVPKMMPDHLLHSSYYAPIYSCVTYVDRNKWCLFLFVCLVHTS